MFSEQEMQAAPLLSLRGIVKRFGSFPATDAISLDMRAGEAHGLIGENGAGKSTLVKIIYGLLEPTAGVIALRASRCACKARRKPGRWAWAWCSSISPSSTI